MNKNNTKIGTWEIEPDGSMLHEKPYYCIEGNRLGEGNWLTHMVAKNWVDAREFVRAYFIACQIRGLESVTLNPNYMI
jgi:hypothetical protein